MKEAIFYLCGIFSCMIIWFLWAIIAYKKAKEAPLKEYARIHIDIEKAIRENEEQIVMIARLEKELSTVQSKKTKAIEALAKLRLEKQKIAGESKGNEVVRAWAEAVVKARREEKHDG